MISLRDACLKLYEQSDIKGKGFNRVDLKWIPNLLLQQKWTDKQKKKVYNAIKKYHSQFEELGITFNEIEKPMTDEQKIYITSIKNNTQITIHFSYGCDDFDAIKNFIKNDLDGEYSGEKYWILDKPSFEQISLLKNKFVSKYSDRIEETVDWDGVVEMSPYDIFVYFDQEEVYRRFVFDMKYDCDNFWEIKDILKGYEAYWEKRGKNWLLPKENIDIAYEDLKNYKNIHWENVSHHLEYYDSENHESPDQPELDEKGFGDELADLFEEESELSEFRILSNAKDSDYKEPGTFDGELLSYQRPAVEYAIKKVKNERTGTLFGDEMGLGKTVEALCTVEDLSAYKCIIITPASVKYKFKKEINQFLPHRTCYVMEGWSSDYFPRKDIDFYILNYDILSRRMDDLTGLEHVQSIVLDEIHYIKNNTTKRTKSALQLVNYHKPLLRLGLSGTAIKNKKEELIQPLKFLNVLQRHFGSEQQFLENVCNAKYVIRLRCKGEEWKRLKSVIKSCDGYFDNQEKAWIIPTVNKSQFWKGAYKTGIKNVKNKFHAHYSTENTATKETNKKLREACLVRRRKKDIEDDIPPLIRDFIPIEIDYNKYLKKEGEVLHEIDEKHREKKNKLKQEVISLEKELSSIDLDLLDKYKKKRKELPDKSSQDYDHAVVELQELEEHFKDADRSTWTEYIKKQERYENLERFGPAKELNLLNQMRKYLAEEKLKGIKQWIKDTLEETQLIVFGWHKDVLKNIYQEFENDSVLVTGDVTGQKRQDCIDKFQNEEVSLFIGNTKACGTGINLTASKLVSFVEFEWTPADHEQAEARAYFRMNDPHGINSYYFVAKGPDDEPTVDSDMIDLLALKNKVSSIVLDGEMPDHDFSETNMREEVWERILKRHNS